MHVEGSGYLPDRVWGRCHQRPSSADLLGAIGGQHGNAGGGGGGLEEEVKGVRVGGGGQGLLAEVGQQRVPIDPRQVPAYIGGGPGAQRAQAQQVGQVAGFLDRVRSLAVVGELAEHVVEAALEVPEVPHGPEAGCVEPAAQVEAVLEGALDLAGDLPSQGSRADQQEVAVRVGAVEGEQLRVSSLFQDHPGPGPLLDGTGQQDLVALQTHRDVPTEGFHGRVVGPTFEASRGWPVRTR